MNLDCEFATTESFVVKWTAPLYMPEPLTGYVSWLVFCTPGSLPPVGFSSACGVFN